MKARQCKNIKSEHGFIAALDQSGGSSPKTLADYGISEDMYDSEDQMFNLIHEMRTRIITSPTFNSKYIIASILFEQTMDSKIHGMYTSDYLSTEKNIASFLKIDQGLANEINDVQLMKPINNLDHILKRANERNIFGTKMRSVIKEPNQSGIKEVVEQQFQIGKQIIHAGLVPIIESEVDIHSSNKSLCESLLKDEIEKQINYLNKDEVIMLKLTIPNQNNLYKDFTKHPQVLRLVALSGGYSRKDATKKLQANNGMIASFSRALTQDLHANQTDEQFDQTLKEAITSIYKASLT